MLPGEDLQPGSAMLQPFDQLLKEILCRLSAPFGEARPSEKLGSEPQEADIVFFARWTPVEVSQELSLLARMFSATCIVEGYHRTPGLDLVLGCMRKQLVLHHRLVQAEPEQTMPVPALWILSAGKPKSAIEGLRYEQARAWSPR